jgi:5'-nucleotidase
VPPILVTNDDGIHAAGLAALADALAELGDVWVIAPEREQSACGHALTLHRPLRAVAMGERRFAVNGTPSDCVNLGVLGFLPEAPALVVSGINHGGNLGDDVTYSGTVSAAMEATLLGVPAIAISLLDGGDLAHAAPVARLVAARVLVEGLPRKTLLNVNVPPQAPRGLRVTRLGHRVYSDKIVEQTDPRGRTHYWIGAGAPAWEALEGTDMGAIHDGFVAVTPLHLDLTHHGALARMSEWGTALSAQLKRDGGRR